MKRILLAYDGGEPAIRALETTVDLAAHLSRRCAEAADFEALPEDDPLRRRLLAARDRGVAGLAAQRGARARAPPTRRRRRYVARAHASAPDWNAARLSVR